MQNLRTAYVYINNIYAGMLSETDEGYYFSYDNKYLENPSSTAVSLTMPLRNELYESKFLFPFFDGLIPEGWLLNVVCHNWKISPKDRFGIMLVACRDSIGNVCISNTKEISKGGTS